MKHRVITISREFGSGGRTIGKKVAETLQIPCYDSELIQKIAQESDFAEGYVKEVDESSKGGFLASAFSSSRAFGPTNEDYLWEIQRKVILGLAEQGPCVIVGRCSESILKGYDGLVSIFVLGDWEAKRERIMRLYNLSPEEAEQELNTWTLASGRSSSRSSRACSALLWEPLSRADRVTT